ncbi:ubiquitin-like domain-containing protein [uncultured Thermanaerothrix sp.]|uniref:ubiquitin-like domain-containing protein n=1 Tax=uncultured Thermanaerothrix sp. TaxID=1195149 RepID=UPI002620ABCA|nr:ubiquitin-like domain-containing protein [uncultured Thermanaerothrix sp.]
MTTHSDRRSHWLLTLAVLCGLVGAGLLLVGLERTVPVRVDGEWWGIRTRALTLGSLLRAANLAPRPEDRLLPARPALTPWWNAPLILERARLVRLALWPEHRGTAFSSAERIPANLLLQAGVRLFPHDRIYWQGQPIDPYQPLPPATAYHLEIRRAIPLTWQDNGRSGTCYSAAVTLGEALTECALRLENGDQISPAPDTLLTPGIQVTVRRARSLQVQTSGTTLTLRSSAATVGEALAEAGIALQGLDYSQPPEDQPLPVDGIIRVVRVREEVLLEQKVLPFKNEYEPDPDTELDQRRVIEPGEYGIEVNRLRVRYEDGQEIRRTVEAEWVAKAPKPQRVGYGTKVVIRTLETPQGPLEYWRAVTVYATSYSPCRLGVNRCSTATASGLPLQHGIIAVTRTWYSWMLGQRLYVPGYGIGVVADVGGGVPGRYWIDLGYSDNDYQPWHQYVTVYFLTPVPSAIPWILP